MIFGIIFAVLIVGMIGLNAITKNSTYNELKNASVNDNEAITKIASSLEMSHILICLINMKMRIWATRQ